MKIEYKLTKIQKRIKKEGCPHCKIGKLYAIPDTDENEIYLWCDSCDCSVDSDGGYNY